VVVDSFTGAYQAVQHLVARGHRRIATLRFDVGRARRNSVKKHAGYLSALAAAGIAAREEYAVCVAASGGGETFTCREVRAATERLADLPEPPTALFVENDILSVPLMYPTRDDGGQRPGFLREVAMVHFEDLPLAPVRKVLDSRLGYPPPGALLVTIDWERIGRMAARLMIDQLRDGRDSRTTSIRVAPVLREA